MTDTIRVTVACACGHRSEHNCPTPPQPTDEQAALHARIADLEALLTEAEEHNETTCEAVTARDRAEAERDRFARLAEDRAGRIDTLEHVAAGNKRHVQTILPELWRAEAVIERVKALAHRTGLVDPAEIRDALHGATENDSTRQRAARAEAALARVRRVADLIEAGAPWTASHADTAARIRDAADPQPPATA